MRRLKSTGLNVIEVIPRGLEVQHFKASQEACKIIFSECPDNQKEITMEFFKALFLLSITHFKCFALAGIWSLERFKLGLTQEDVTPEIVDDLKLFLVSYFKMLWKPYSANSRIQSWIKLKGKTSVGFTIDQCPPGSSILEIWCIL